MKIENLKIICQLIENQNRVLQSLMEGHENALEKIGHAAYDLAFLHNLVVTEYLRVNGFEKGDKGPTEMEEAGVPYDLDVYWLPSDYMC